MNMGAKLVAGLKVAAMGSLIGTSIPTLFVLIIAVDLMSEDPAGAMLVMTMPFMIGFAAALAGIVVIALPLTLWLQRSRGESARAYLTGGMIGGAVSAFLVALVLFEGELSGGVFMAIFGALTGSATGHFWWRYMRRDAVENDPNLLTEVFD